MIKELFEIEPIQKNTLIMFIGVFCLSFLQLFVFKRDLIDGNFGVLIGLSLGLSVCWSITNLIPLVFILSASNADNNSIIYDRMIIGMGICVMALLIILTFIGYLLNYNFRDFILLSTVILASVYLVVFFLVAIYSHKKKLKKELKN